MAIDPATARARAAVIRALYEAAETAMLEAVARRLARGIDDEGWAELKLAETAAVRREIERLIARLQVAGPAELAKLLEEAHRAGVAAAAGKVGGPPMVATDAAAVATLLQAQLQLLDQVHVPILRSALDAYRAVVAEAAGFGVTGTLTRRQVADVALRRFADRGVSGFIDSVGRRWDLASYVEMATRSAIGQAYIQGSLTELADRGHDLVMVSDSPDECELCAPWEGQVLSQSGTDPNHGALNDAIGAGLFHVNCTHDVSPYIEGLTRPMRDTADPEGRAERDQQRAMERQIRQWKRRAAAAIDPRAAERASAKVAEKQAAMRSFIAETGRRRDYRREAISGAR